MIPAEGDNVVAAGRCIDADLPALSSVRVMGPCMAMGAAAAKALDLAGTGSVHQIDIAALAEARPADNVERNDTQAGQARPDPDEPGHCDAAAHGRQVTHRFRRFAPRNDG